MTDLSRYELSPLREGDLPLLRGRRDGQIPILVVALQERNAPVEQVKRLEHEYALRAELDIAWAARPVALTRHRECLSLVLEYPGGEPLDQLCGRPWATAEYLRAAIAIASSLRRAHDRGLLHKDVKPANILVDVAGGGAWLTGFGIAARTSRDRPSPDPPELIAGTLAYMAPEQTGRMNLSMDARSDLYGLGVTLYEMLTGELPFTASDPMELIHCHIAQQPVPPSERAPGTPAPLSAIVVKLLAKTAEERYQTAAGLEADLRRCQALYESDGRIDPFPLGARDVPDRLIIPEKLYGRETEIETLLAAFDRVAELGGTGVVLVSGDSGAGKSSLVNELQKVLVAQRGLFASGKFDQYTRDIPYATLAQAFRGLVRALLGQSEAQLPGWRKALNDALGPNGQLIVNLVPELELVIGRQQPVTDLSPPDAQSRFQMVFRRFLGVFARAEHPLALFLDDLQWLDTATLELLEHLATHPEVKHLLIIGAYRGGEVGRSHPLTASIQAIREANGDTREISLGSLSIDDLGLFVADTLHCGRPSAQPLARLLHEKTSGNPFFAIQFLASLVEEKLLAFDSGAMAWGWDIDRIRAKSYTDNVADLMADKLSRLSDATRNALKQLACLGNTAKTVAFGPVHAQEAERVRAQLDEAVNAGFISHRNGVYSFLHDRIQQAAYSLIPEEQRAEVHLHIGRVLLANMTADDLEQRLFDVANQFQRGAALLTDRNEKARVAVLHLRAGQKAKVSAAYSAASMYLAAGASLLGHDRWGDRYDLLFRLQLERAECEFMQGHFDEAEQLIEDVIVHAASMPDLAAACILKVKLYTVKSEFVGATACALSCLESLGITIPAHPSQDRMLAEFDDMWRALNGRPIESLLDLPLMDDPNLLAAMQLLSQMIYVTSSSDSLACLLRCRMVILSLQNGVSGASAIACAYLADQLGALFGRHSDGYRFAKVARDLVARHGFAAHVADVHLALVFAAMWTQPFGTVLDDARSACRITTEAGDVMRVCYSYALMVNLRLLRGEPLEAVLRESEIGLDFARAAGFLEIANLMIGQQRFIVAMQGRTATFSTFNDEQFDQDAFEAALRTSPMTTPYWISKLHARFLSADYGQALAASEMVHPQALSGPGAAVVRLEFCFYTALTLAALLEDAADDVRAEWRERLEAHRAQLRELAQINPSSFGDKHTLVAAEIARLEGRDEDAMRLYEQAIQSAREHGFVQHEALAYEVAARFYTARGFETIAQAYLRAARRGYLRWGAEAKVEQLEQLHPLLREAPIPPPSGGGAAIERLDIETVIKASQALSREIQLPELIQTLMRIVLEHAGAERGVLILYRGGDAKIEAVAATVDEGVEVVVREREVTQSDLPLSMFQYVVRTRESVVLDDALAANLYSEDDYVRRKSARSVLCLPILNQAHLVGVLYLENNLTPRAFTADRVAVLEMLASQVAISLENARLFSALQTENSDRRRVEEDLRRSEAYLHESQRLARMGSFVLDPYSERIRASPELLRILGRDLDAEGTAIDFLRDYIHPEDRQSIDEQRARAIEEKVAWQYEFRIVTPDNSIRYIESTASPVLNNKGELVEYIGTMIDLTDRKVAEQHLKMSETLLTEAQKLSHTGSYVINGPFGESIWTPEMFRIFEFDPNERPSVEKALQRIHPEDRDRMRQFASKAFDGRSRTSHVGAQAPVEYRLLMPDGRVKVVLSLRAPAGPEFSGVGTIIGATMDVTDRKSAEDALRRAQADLAHASRVNTMGELTAALAHEVNQPIAAAVTNANACMRFLAGETPDIEEAREAAAAIVRAGTRAAEIVSRTREFFKKGVTQKALVEVDDLVRDTVVLLESEARRYAISIRTRLAADYSAVMGDHVQLQQVIVNLIMNSIDAMKDVEGLRVLAVGTQRTDEGQIVVSVSDTGLGLPAQGADRIFDTFFTTKADGTGMGLSISRSIIEAHGGRIWAAPNTPRGTILEVALPGAV